MTYYPFAELVIGDEFAFHPSHKRETEFQGPFYVKESRDSFRNSRTGRLYELDPHEIYNTWVTQVTIPV